MYEIHLIALAMVSGHSQHRNLLLAAGVVVGVVVEVDPHLHRTSCRSCAEDLQCIHVCN